MDMTSTTTRIIGAAAFLSLSACTTVKQLPERGAACALVGCGCPPGTPPPPAPPAYSDDTPASRTPLDWNESQSVSDPQENK